MGAPPQAGAGTMPGQPPFGPSPTTMPTPNRGHQAAGLAQVAVAVRILEKALPMLGAESEPGGIVMKTITNLAKLVPQGSTSQGVENQAMQGLMQQQKQEQPMLQVMRSMGQGGAGQPPGGASPSGEPPAG